MIQYKFTKRSVDEKISSGKNKSGLWEIDQLDKLENLHNENQSKPFVIITTLDENAFVENEESVKSFFWKREELDTINFEIKGAIREELLQSDKTKALRRFFGFVKRNWHNQEREIYPKSFASRVNTQVFKKEDFSNLLKNNSAFKDYIKPYIDQSEIFESLKDDDLICTLSIFDIRLDSKRLISFIDKLWNFIKSSHCQLLQPLALISLNDTNDEDSNIKPVDNFKWTTGANTITEIEAEFKVFETVTGWSTENEYILSSSDKLLKDIYDFVPTNSDDKNHYIINQVNHRITEDNEIKCDTSFQISQIRGILRNAYWYLISSLKGSQSVEPHPKGHLKDIDWLDRLFGRMDTQSRLKMYFDDYENILFTKKENNCAKIHDFLYKRLFNNNEQKPPHIQILGINNVNSTIKFRIENLQSSEFVALLLSFDLINLGFFRIGKMKSRGFGRFSIFPKIIKSTELKQYLEEGNYTNISEMPNLSGYEICKNVLNIKSPFKYLSEKY